MLAYAFFKPIESNLEFENALFSEIPENLLKFSAPLEKAFLEIKCWSENAGMGRTLSCFGDQICIEIPLNKITELSEFLRKFEYSSKMIFAIGVGLTILEAFKAMKVSESLNGEKVILYSEELEECLDGQELEKALTSTEEEYCIEIPGLNFDKEEEPQISQEQSKQKDKQTTKQKIVEALIMIKQNSQDISKLKEINPQAFEAVKKVIDSMISMANNQLSNEMGKSELSQDNIESASVVPQIQMSIKKKKKKKVEEELSESPKETKELEKAKDSIPVGSIRGHKIRVESRDEITRRKDGEHDHVVSSGMAMGPTGHAVSAREPDKK